MCSCDWTHRRCYVSACRSSGKLRPILTRSDGWQAIERAEHLGISISQPCWPHQEGYHYFCMQKRSYVCMLSNTSITYECSRNRAQRRHYVAACINGGKLRPFLTRSDGWQAIERAEHLGISISQPCLTASRKVEGYHHFCTQQRSNVSVLSYASIRISKESDELNDYT